MAVSHVSWLLMGAALSASLSGALIAGQPPEASARQPARQPAGQPAGPSASPAPTVVTRTALLQPPAAGEEQPPAVTYDPAQAPVDARLTVTAVSSERETTGETTVVFRADGLQPNRAYGVHVHVNSCGPEPSDAGPHYQHEQDPAATPDQPSADPAYANPQNEIWLDITTDSHGNGSSVATVPFGFDERAPASVVVHEELTQTGPGEAGAAGDRLACLNVPFQT